MKCYDVGEIDVHGIFVSDLHGNKKRIQKFFSIVKKEKPNGVFIGGDILPNGFKQNNSIVDFLENDFFAPLKTIKKQYHEKIQFYLILGNDDPRIYEHSMIKANQQSLLNYMHNNVCSFGDLFTIGYSYVPPTPFLLKDWERYDVSRYVDPGSISPEEGYRSIDIDKDEKRYATIQEDLQHLVKLSPPKKTVYLFHAPPYQSRLDRTDLDGKTVDHVPLDVHTGSIAIQRFIQKYNPLVTLHGHIHESPRLTGYWQEKIGSSYSFSAAHDGPELAVVSFDTEHLGNATRRLV